VAHGLASTLKAALATLSAAKRISKCNSCWEAGTSGRLRMLLLLLLLSVSVILLDGTMQVDSWLSEAGRAP
jgi:hypothetical protein